MDDRREDPSEIRQQRRRIEQLPRVALVGRPNVGKSSLFNRLLGRREAIVHDRPGVTRDRLERPCRLERRDVLLLDTGGLIPDAEESLAQTVTKQALRAGEQAHVIVFIVDGRSGLTPLDETIAGLLRRDSAKVVLAVNKIDVPSLRNLAAEMWALGFDEPVPISAEHAEGIDELIERVEERLPQGDDEVDACVIEATSRVDPEDELSMAVVGRPNVGKSSIINSLAGAERIAVSPIPGTTRDAIDVLIEREGRWTRLVDTAGLRKRSKVRDRDEGIGIMMTRRRLERCHVAMLVIDASMGVTSQDVGIAGEIERMGRPLILVLNKWDLVENPERAFITLDRDLSARLSFARQAPRIAVSAQTGQRISKILDLGLQVARAASRRIGTGELNRFLAKTVGERLSHGGSAPKMLYSTQLGILPPRFVIFCRRPWKVDAPFKRFVEKRLREAFDFGPTPVIVDFREPPRRS